jgi:hypothetical protein
LRAPVLLALANQLLIGPLVSVATGPMSAFIVMNALRVLTIALAGWRVIRAKAGGLWAASWAGPAVLFFDHVVAKGGVMVVAAIAGVKDGWLAVRRRVGVVRDVRSSRDAPGMRGCGCGATPF